MIYTRTTRPARENGSQYSEGKSQLLVLLPSGTIPGLQPGIEVLLIFGCIMEIGNHWLVFAGS